jgi:hypothetical protein
MSGLSPNVSDPRLTGRIQPEWRVRPIGQLGRDAGLLGRLGHARRGRGEQASRADSLVSAHSARIKRKSFLFSKLFYNLQTNLNAIQI